MASKAKRDQIVALKTAGVSNKDITKQMNVCRKTVFNTWKRYMESTTTSSKSIPGRKRSIRTKKTIEAVKKRMNRNPCRSARKTAKALDISKSSMHRIFKEDLKLTAYKKQSQQLISATSKKKPLDKDKTMLAEMRQAAKSEF